LGTYADKLEICLATNEKEEVALLEKFWQMFHACEKCIGYNIIGFDLPYLLTRSMAYGLPTGITDTNFYHNPKILDLMKLLYAGRIDKTKSLKFLAKRYGLKSRVPLEVDGSCVEDMSMEELTEYCLSDVTLVDQLYHKMLGVYF